MPSTMAVVTPSFNQARYIERTIQSVITQDVAGLDYMVIDGGSNDGTVDILRRYGNRPRWVSEKDGGQADAVNKGIRQTEGEIIGWLNSDDIYYPGALRAVLDYFATNPECDVVYGNANHIDEHDGIIEPYPSEAWNANRLREVCFICQPSVFFRRRVVEENGLLDEQLQYCMDYEYWLRLARNGVRVHRIARLLAGSRLHEETKTLGARVKVHREINDMMRRHLGRVPERWLYNYAHAVLDDKGIPRTRFLKFALGLAVLSCCASLRWNHRLSGDVLRTTSRWVWHNSIAACKETITCKEHVS
jgi:glycosyltransferase involved in cell wall biosynthesis